MLSKILTTFVVWILHVQFAKVYIFLQMPLKLLYILTFLTFSLTALGQSVVVIDAGHGGKSPGAVSGKVYEKNINLDIALLVEEHLKSLDNTIKVIQTRRTDKDLTLYQRADMANDNKANLFMSIHTNSNPSNAAIGCETYVMGVDKSGKNLSVAMLENSVITLEPDYQKRYQGYDPNSPESFIIFSLMQYAYLEQSLKLAENVQNQYAKRIPLKNRGVKQEGFLVLWRTTMPSILTEVGFISNEKDRAYITSSKGQNEIALSLANAIVDFLKQNRSDEPLIEQVTTKVDNKMADNDVQANEGVFYTVQVKTTNKKITINPSNFGQWVSVVKEFESQKMYKYSVGEVFSYKDALTLQTKLKAKFNDCFVVAYRNGVRITLKEAQQILGK